MRLPAPLLRNKKNVHKNDFGHVLILAGSPTMLGAAALCGLAAMRAGAGLVSIGVPKSLNLTLQKKISSAIMTWPLPETRQHSIAFSAASEILKKIQKFDVVAVGPGLGQHKSTENFIYEIIKRSTKPLLIDADALNALAKNPSILKRSNAVKVLTPHPGEMARLTGLSKEHIEKHRKKIALDFARRFTCTLVLKGHKTVVSSSNGEIFINTTGNPAMAKAGSGDVLTGIIAAFIAQGIAPFESAKLGVFLHGKAGDKALHLQSRPSLIATDIIESLPSVFR